MSIHIYSDQPDAGFDIRELRCDGGGWKGCSSYFEGGIGDHAPAVRATAKRKGWTRVRYDGGTIDLCPGCSDA